MARPRTPIGTFGGTRFDAQPNGRVRALTRFRDHDGVLRRVTATGASRTAAERHLKAVLSCCLLAKGLPLRNADVRPDFAV